MRNAIAIISLIGLLICGCSTDQPSAPQPAGHVDQVHVGMTKDEVLKALGHKPKTVEQTPDGEVWHYDNTELAMIPFNFGFRPEFKSFVFNRDGVLVDYHITQPTR
jgi:hypothetical protein